jgi:hypothetical protein
MLSLANTEFKLVDVDGRTEAIEAVGVRMASEVVEGVYMTAPPAEVELALDCDGVSWTPLARLARDVDAVPEKLGAFEFGIL